ncbi:hypothetical protein ABZV31_30470 [Streptomyces sp. NPDC005202]|uniref:hypothetical protein n=1 Tax=Streptomyces sp. NPDC005202 TaxID=3157021 RepID=UPI0033B17662
MLGGQVSFMLGRPCSLDAELAGERVAEVFGTVAPRQVARGRAHPPECALRLEATDTGAWWTDGPGAPVATLAAPRNISCSCCGAGCRPTAGRSSGRATGGPGGRILDGFLRP